MAGGQFNRVEKVTFVVKGRDCREMPAGFDNGGVAIKDGCLPSASVSDDVLNLPRPADRLAKKSIPFIERDSAHDDVRRVAGGEVFFREVDGRHSGAVLVSANYNKSPSEERDRDRSKGAENSIVPIQKGQQDYDEIAEVAVGLLYGFVFVCLIGYGLIIDARVSRDWRRYYQKGRKAKRLTRFVQPQQAECPLHRLLAAPGGVTAITDPESNSIGYKPRSSR
ncbi:MAG TPA: hypothetical protein VII73_11775 [Caulobacteraceae bacterium]